MGFSSLLDHQVQGAKHINHIQTSTNKRLTCSDAFSHNSLHTNCPRPEGKPLINWRNLSIKSSFFKRNSQKTDPPENSVFIIDLYSCNAVHPHLWWIEQRWGFLMFVENSRQFVPQQQEIVRRLWLYEHGDKCFCNYTLSQKRETEVPLCWCSLKLQVSFVVPCVEAKGAVSVSAAAGCSPIYVTLTVWSTRNLSWCPQSAQPHESGCFLSAWQSQRMFFLMVGRHV